jgi:uncharacterized membrane protein YbhN (UPF0104 family)
MRIDRRRGAAAALASATLLGAVFWVSGFAIPDVSRIAPAWAAATLAAYMVLTIGRATLLLALAPAGRRAGFAAWVRLAARHQILFSLLPTGAGDVGFVPLAQRVAGIPPADAIRILAQYRLRDALVLGLLGVAGLAFSGLAPIFGIVVLMLGGAALWFADDIAGLLLGVVGAALPGARAAAFLKSAVPAGRSTPRQRLERTGLAVGCWATSALALHLGFAAAGAPLGFDETLLMLVALNAAGAIAISVAGFGVAEAGVSGALIALGRAPADAAATALVVRPLLLLVIVGACVTLEIVVTLLGRRTRPAAARL